MPTTYQTAPAGLTGLVAQTLRKTHPRLDDAGLDVTVLLAFNPDGPAVVQHGSPALGTIKVTALKDRVCGLGDVRIVLDGDRWDGLSAAQQAAAIDHLLTSLVPQTKGDRPKKDDAGRPVLKVRQPDFEVRGFWDVVERHKEAAPESAAFDGVNRGFIQRLFPWGMA
jgi:hypothetical protein